MADKLDYTLLSKCFSSFTSDIHRLCEYSKQTELLKKHFDEIIELRLQKQKEKQERIDRQIAIGLRIMDENDELLRRLAR